jgi:arylsulfatase A-like enzyme
MSFIFITSGACYRAEQDWPGEMLEGKVIRDLLVEVAPAQSRGQAGPRQRQTDFDIRVTVPDDGQLRIAGRARSPRKAGKRNRHAEFEVRVDGRTVFSRRVALRQKADRFEETVPLEGFAGRSAILEFSIDRPAGAVAFWRRATLEQLHQLPRQHASDGPNLLLVVVDTLRADHCSLHGYHRATTPHLDALGDRATVFDRAISPASWTSPSVASVFTGLYPLEHGLTGGGTPLAFEHETVAELLQNQGLTTLAVSSNPLIGPDAAFDQGFEVFHQVPWARADEVNAIFLPIVEKVADVRWFGYLHYIDPHTPYDAPRSGDGTWIDPAYDGPFTDVKAVDRLYLSRNFGLESNPPFDDRDVEFLLASYDEEILYWDRHFHELLDGLDQRGLLSDTIVIVTSDHGEEFNEHGMFKHGHQLFQESIWVPLVIHAPGRLAPGRRSELVEIRELKTAISELLDLAAPTAHPPNPLLRAGLDDRPVFSHTSRPMKPRTPRPRTSLASVLHTHWKFIAWLDSDRVELFDLEADGGETVNLAQGRADLAGGYSELLTGWVEATAARGKPEGLADPALIDKLRALGYLE